MKRGSGLKRASPLKAKSQPKVRTTPIKAKNAKRAKKAHTEDFGPPGFADFVREYGCVVARDTGSLSGCAGRVEFCHRKSRGAGGGWRNNSFGACTKHHREQHDAGINTWEKRHSFDLDLWCCAITHQYEKRNGWHTERFHQGDNE